MGTEDNKTEKVTLLLIGKLAKVRKKNQNPLLNWLSVYRLMVTYLEYGFNRLVRVCAC